MTDSTVDRGAAHRAAAKFACSDSARFGFPIHRADCGSPEDLQEAVRSAEGAGSELLIARFPAHLSEFGEWLADFGKRYVFADTLVYYQREITAERPVPMVNGYRERLAEPKDAKVVERLIADIFGDYTSHYRWNSRTNDREKVALGYGDWARGLVVDQTSFTYLLESEVGGPVGVACTRVLGEVGDIALAGVHREHGRQGLYRCIMEGSYNQFRRQGQVIQEISTQVHNLNVQKVWVRCGMEMVRTACTVHIDLRDAIPARS